MIDLRLRSAAARSTRSIIGTGSRKPLLQRRAGLDEIAARVELFAYEMLRYLAVAGLGQLVPEEHAARLLVAGELVLEEGEQHICRGGLHLLEHDDGEAGQIGRATV